MPRQTTAATTTNLAPARSRACLRSVRAAVWRRPLPHRSCRWVPPQHLTDVALLDPALALGSYSRDEVACACAVLAAGIVRRDVPLPAPALLVRVARQPAVRACGEALLSGVIALGMRPHHVVLRRHLLLQEQHQQGKPSPL